MPAEKIQVIYPGTPEGYGPSSSQDRHHFREKYRIERPYILYSGSFHPRKNVLCLVQAFEQIADKIPHDLVLKVSARWQDEGIRQRVLSSRVSARIHVIEATVPSNELAWLYQNCDLFVFPSLYEGFGFPVLEAFACGCPVISANISSLPEVAGEAAILFPPEDASALGAAILQVTSTPDFRDSLRLRGLERARYFSWSNTARQTLSLLEEAAVEA
jgi:glycosyltransferase involved in cell wall biosynthesis